MRFAYFLGKPKFAYFMGIRPADRAALRRLRRAPYLYMLRARQGITYTIDRRDVRQ